MKLLFKQRFFSWFDSYEIYDIMGNVVYTVEGKFGWGHKLHILGREGRHIATVKQALFTFMPRYELYKNEEFIGTVQKKFNIFEPCYVMDFAGWRVTGSFFEWDYKIINSSGTVVATVEKELFNLTDTYTIDTANDADALYALMFTLAIDAEKCSRKD